MIVSQFSFLCLSRVPYVSSQLKLTYAAKPYSNRTKKSIQNPIEWSRRHLAVSGIRSFRFFDPFWVRGLGYLNFSTLFCFAHFGLALMALSRILALHCHKHFLFVILFCAFWAPGQFVLCFQPISSRPLQAWEIFFFRLYFNISSACSSHWPVKTHLFELAAVSDMR